MRTVNFRDGILFPMADRLGIARDQDDLDVSVVTSWLTFINDRVEEGWELLRLPELKATEERAFRTIWNATALFVRSNPAAAGRPDEFLYLPNMTYYQVNPDAAEDPPAGSIPPDWAAGGEELDVPGPPEPYFIAIALLTDTYIDLDQRGRHAMGDILGVYHGNPAYQNCAWHGLDWRLSERGLEVRASGRTSVFVRFRIRPSKFAAEYWEGELPYGKTALVYYREDGQVYRALQDNNTGVVPTQTTHWGLVPMPAALAQFVVLAAASDACEDLKTSAKWLQQAYSSLERKHSGLSEQGERVSYRPFTLRRRVCGVYSSLLGWYCSPCWTPADGEVTTLTDIWQDDEYYSPAHLVTEEGAILI